LVCDEFEIDRTNWITRELPDEDVDATVKIRYSHPGTPATVTSLRIIALDLFGRTSTRGHTRTGRGDLRW